MLQSSQVRLLVDGWASRSLRHNIMAGYPYTVDIDKYGPVMHNLESL